MTRLAIVGAGSWGTALAQSLSSTALAVTLWARDPQVADELRRTRAHPWALPGVMLDARADVTSSLRTAVCQADVVILAVPSQAMRETVVACASHLAARTVLVSAAKGFESGTGLTMSTVIESSCGDARPRVAALSGPNIAIEVARGLPAATVVASADPAVAALVRDACNGGALRFYSSDDLIGVEFAGALKNVVAIAAGICDGMGVGDNGKAALITRGITEMARLARSCGASPLTFSGLAGLGDCIVTCMSPHSRNRHLGQEIGQGIAPAAAVAATHMVVEGVNATRVAHMLAERQQVDMPITREIHAVLFADKSVGTALRDLMTRGAVSEFRGLDLAGA